MADKGGMNSILSQLDSIFVSALTTMKTTFRTISLPVNFKVVLEGEEAFPAGLLRERDEPGDDPLLPPDGDAHHQAQPLRLGEELLEPVAHEHGADRAADGGERGCEAEVQHQVAPGEDDREEHHEEPRDDAEDDGQVHRSLLLAL